VQQPGPDRDAFESDEDLVDTEDGASETPASGPAGRPPAPLSMDRYLPILAIFAMLATFVVLPPSVAMTLIGAIWLAGTRLTRSRRLLGLSLTEALAWAATVTIIEFVSIVVLYTLGGAGAAQ
jgi:hypothetical protein